MVLNHVAVTGASGMVGQNFLALLDKLGISCTAFSRHRPDELSKNTSWTEWDLNEQKSVEELNGLMGAAQAIFHVGARVPLPNETVSQSEFFNTNVQACSSLGEYGLRKNIPVIYLSGGIVYANQNGRKLIETNPTINSADGENYGLSKLGGEQAFLSLASQGLKVCILRASSIYGPHMSDKKMIASFLHQASRGEQIVLSQPVDDKINLIYAEDVANAMWRAVNRDAFGIYNIAGNVANSIFEIAETCTEVVGNGRVVVNPNPSERLPYVRFDLNCDKARSAFGFHPQFDIKLGIDKMWGEMSEIRRKN